jgi:hypothetical protein
MIFSRKINESCRYLYENTSKDTTPVNCFKIKSKEAICLYVLYLQFKKKSTVSLLPLSFFDILCYIESLVNTIRAYNSPKYKEIAIDGFCDFVLATTSLQLNGFD